MAPPAVATLAHEKALPQKRPIKAGDIAKYAALILTTVGGALGAAKYATGDAAQKQDAKQDITEARIAVLEVTIQRLANDLVPRGEHQAHWDAQQKQMDSVQADVREIRAVVVGKRP